MKFKEDCFSFFFFFKQTQPHNLVKKQQRFLTVLSIFFFVIFKTIFYIGELACQVDAEGEAAEDGVH